MEILEVIIASSVIASLISSLFVLLQSRIDYRNEYYKKIIEKRFQSYEMIERVLYFFSTVVTDFQDNRMYHVIFGDQDNPLPSEYHKLMTNLSKSNIWISERVRDELCKLNYFIIQNDIDFNNIEAGKKYYKELGNIRNNILIVVKQDVLNLHKVRRTLREEVKLGMIMVELPKKEDFT